MNPRPQSRREPSRRNLTSSQYAASGMTQELSRTKTEEFSQAGEQWRSFSKQQKADLIEALAADLNQIHDHGIKLREVSYFYKADHDYGTEVAQATHLDVNELAALAGREASR